MFNVCAVGVRNEKFDDDNDELLPPKDPSNLKLIFPISKRFFESCGGAPKYARKQAELGLSHNCFVYKRVFNWGGWDRNQKSLSLKKKTERDDAANISTVFLIFNDRIYN
jgi:hypothetical protein